MLPTNDPVLVSRSGPQKRGLFLLARRLYGEDDVHETANR
jgi:hypothetical protein